MKKNNYLIYSAILFFGLILGYFIFSPSSDSNHEVTENEVHQIYTCAMHPQIRQDKPGNCPICGMQLVPVSSTNSQSKTSLTMSKSAMKLAQISTVLVYEKAIIKEIILPAEVKYNQALKSSISAQFDGRVNQLIANYLGKSVKKGETVALVYAPILSEIHRELIEAQKRNDASLVKVTEDRLKQVLVDSKTIEKMKSARSPWLEFPINSQVDGVISELNVSKNDSFEKGKSLIQLDDISILWIEANVQESDISYFKLGQSVEVTLANKKVIHSKVSFINPIVNPDTRTSTIRLEIDNKNNQIKAGMLAQIKVEIPLESSLIIPKTAVLWTGKKSIVYVQNPNETEPTFEARIVEIGDSSDEFVQVISGLTEGEIVVQNGVFRVDSAAQLANVTSMMNGETKSEQNKSIHKFTSLSKETTKQLIQVLDAYFVLKNELVKSDLGKTILAAQKLDEKIDLIGHSDLEPSLHDYWMEISYELGQILDKIKKTNDLGLVRAQFILLSKKMIELAKSVPISEKIIYVQFCPMADSDRGATWLSEQEEIRNPYYGTMMLTCGETIEKLD